MAFPDSNTTFDTLQGLKKRVRTLLLYSDIMFVFRHLLMGWDIIERTIQTALNWAIPIWTLVKLRL